MARTLYQIHTEPVSTRPETVTADRWLLPLSQPFYRATLPVACAVAALAWAGTTPQGDAAAAWSAPLSTPVRVAPALRAGLQQAHVEPVSTSPEAVHVAAWAQPWSLPRWSPPAIRAAAQPSLAWSGFTPAPPSSTWFQPLAEPQRRRGDVLTPALAWSPLTTATPVVTPLLGWLQPFPTPLWPRAHQQWLAPAFVWLPPVSVTAVTRYGAIAVDLRTGVIPTDLRAVTVAVDVRTGQVPPDA